MEKYPVRVFFHFSQNGKLKGGAFVYFAFDLHLATHDFRQTFRDRKSETGSTILPGGGVVCLGERFEEAI